MRFADLLLILRGATSGEQIIKAAATASGAITLPAGTTDFSGSGPGLVQQASSGAAFTVAPTSGSLTVGAPGAVSGGTLAGDVVAQRVMVNANAATAPAPFYSGHVQLTGANDTVSTFETSAFGSQGFYFVSRRAGGTAALPTATRLGHVIHGWQFRGYSPAGWSLPRASLEVRADQDWTDTAQGTRLNIGTTPNGSTTMLTNMALDGSGNLTTGGGIAASGNSIGVTNSTIPTVGAGNPSGTPTYVGMQCSSGLMYFSKLNADFTYNNWLATMDPTNLGNFTISGATATKVGGGSWVAPSEARLKRDVTPFGEGLAAVLALEPISYEYNGEAGIPVDGRRYIGLDAEHARDVLSDLVSAVSWPGAAGEEPQTILGVDSGPLVYVLLNAVKELSARVETLEAALSARDAPTG